MSMTSVFAPITKSVDQEDGSVLVYGKATDGGLDLDHQRCDPSWLAEAMPTWYRTGANVREQHDPHRAVGKAIEHEIADDGHYVTARIVDPVAVAKTKAGVFTGFSIGIRNPKIKYDKSSDASNGIVEGGDIVELSLCDRPANPSCLITLCKAAKPGMQVKAGDFDAQRLLVRCEEFVDKSVSPELKKADMTVTLADSLSPEQVERLEGIASQKAGEPELVKDVAEVDGSVATGCGCCDKCAVPGDGCCDVCGPDGEPVEAEQKAAEVDVAQLDDALAKTALGEAGLLGAAGSGVQSHEFDRDAALALVKSVLVKAPATEDLGVEVPPVMVPEEHDDIMGAKAAIAIIAQLIQSEAADMVCAPNEDYDIECLMQAVSALRVFIMREKGELGGEPNLMLMSATADVEKAKYTADELRQMLKDGKAFKNPDGDPSYPIGDRADLENAIHAVGRGSGDHDAIRAFIMRRAKALGAADMIPDNWSSSKAAKTEEPMTEEALDKAIAELETVDDAEKAADAVLEKAVVVDEGAEEAPVEKAAVEASDPEALVKALTAALEKADNPLRKTFEAIVEAATETTVKSVSDLTERLVQVESMAVPGGPVLRRTEVENKAAQKADLIRQAERWETKVDLVSDRDLQKGYTANAVELRRQAEALV